MSVRAECQWTLSNIRHVASELECLTVCISDGVWLSRAISISGLSETGMFFVRDPTDSELTVRQFYTFL